MTRPGIYYNLGFFKRLHENIVYFNFYKYNFSEENLSMITQKADLITAYLYSWDEKSRKLDCIDFSTQEVVDISIPYDQSPQSYAKKLYVKARKLKRSISILNILMEKVATKIFTN